MGRVLSPGFWVQIFLSVLLTMLIIVAWKKILGRVNVPVLSAAANQV